MPSDSGPDWRVVVPVKGARTAKTRLIAPAGVDHAQLARALAVDTIAAVRAAGYPVTVVTSDAEVTAEVQRLGAQRVDDPGRGLNAAVAAGVATLPAGVSVAVLLGDLPALLPQDLVKALTACVSHPAAIVPDHAGTGTVLLTAARAELLRPAFGTGSAARHGHWAHRLDLDLPRLRTDVDDGISLALAYRLGLGPRTRAALSDGAAPPTYGIDEVTRATGRNIAWNSISGSAHES